jgi:hypothetical protein
MVQRMGLLGSLRRTGSLSTKSGARGYLLGPGAGVAGADIKANQASTGGVLTLIESRTTGGAPVHIHSRDGRRESRLIGYLLSF